MVLDAISESQNYHPTLSQAIKVVPLEYLKTVGLIEKKKGHIQVFAAGLSISHVRRPGLSNLALGLASKALNLFHSIRWAFL